MNDSSTSFAWLVSYTNELFDVEIRHISQQQKNEDCHDGKYSEENFFDLLALLN